jgi:hypothetical protein
MPVRGGPDGPGRLSIYLDRRFRNQSRREATFGPVRRPELVFASWERCDKLLTVCGGHKVARLRYERQMLGDSFQKAHLPEIASRSKSIARSAGPGAWPCRSAPPSTRLRDRARPMSSALTSPAHRCARGGECSRR